MMVLLLMPMLMIDVIADGTTDALMAVDSSVVYTYNDNGKFD